MMNEVLYRPVFVGYTQAGEKVVIYTDWNDTLHIKFEGGELRAIGPQAEYCTSRDTTTSIFRLSLRSPQWTGDAVGTRKDLIAEEGIRAP